MSKKTIMVAGIGFNPDHEDFKDVSDSAQLESHPAFQHLSDSHKKTSAVLLYDAIKKYQGHENQGEEKEPEEPVED